MCFAVFPIVYVVDVFLEVDGCGVLFLVFC